uniref:myelin protein zero-like protein 3 isoform X2 n=1 Tax=Myxine glutinosa TaxID=7769 RepID=UPI00358E27BB
MKLHVGWSFCVVALVMISYGPAVTLGIDNLSVAEGKSVTINCTFSPKPGIPFIVWSWKPQREKRREIIFVCREAHTEVMDNHFSGRVSCPCDAFTGNASLVISSVTKQDSGVFYCCVQNSGLTFRHDVQVYIKGVNTHVENALYLLEMLMPIIVLCSAMVIVVTIGWAMLRMKTWASRNFKKSTPNCLSSDVETPEEGNKITDEPKAPNDLCVFFVQSEREKNGLEKEI